MKRVLGLTVIAIGVFCGGLVVLALLRPGVLASRTLRLAGVDVEFQIRKRHGMLYASATERNHGWTGYFNNGSSSLTALGSTDELGTSGAEIVPEPEHHRVLLRVKGASVAYDTERRSFGFVAASPGN